MIGKVAGEVESDDGVLVIRRIHVRDGQFVEEGAPLAVISNTRRLLLQAEVSQRYLPLLDRIESVNFRTPYIDELQRLEAYNGKMLSRAQVVDPESGFIPVLFELKNVGQLIPGSFAELYLLAGSTGEGLMIPRSAVMEDYDLRYVYVQTGGETYEKRPVELGRSDGASVEVLSGLSEGEWVVSSGAYQVRMASMSSSIPAHGHSH